jgi:hypothetical protein
LVQGGIHWQNNLGQSSLIAVAYDSWKQRGPAVELARELGLPLVNGPAACQYAFLLAFTEERLELREQGTRVPGPVYVDFLGGASAYRRCHGGGRSQALARAVGLKRGATPDVLDATAGLGRDAFTLACLGCRVCLVERSPVIASLLRYGLETAKRDPVLGPLVQERMVLQVNDSIAFMSRVSDRPRPEVVYLDPMHPRRANAGAATNRGRGSGCSRSSRRRPKTCPSTRGGEAPKPCIRPGRSQTECTDRGRTYPFRCVPAHLNNTLQRRRRFPSLQ